MATTSITVRHNIEVAHRLILTPGKCENFHGHSMWVTLTLWGEVDECGLLNGLEFGLIKKLFRERLDNLYDHHLLLNIADDYMKIGLPGAVPMVGDPTTEHIAEEIGEWAERTYSVMRVRVEVQETPYNGAAWER